MSYIITDLSQGRGRRRWSVWQDVSVRLCVCLTSRMTADIGLGSLNVFVSGLFPHHYEPTVFENHTKEVVVCVLLLIARRRASDNFDGQR